MTEVEAVFTFLHKHQLNQLKTNVFSIKKAKFNSDLITHLGF